MFDPKSASTPVSGSRERDAPEDLADASQVTMANSFVCVRRDTGQVACWGSGDSGQLGDGGSTSRYTPVTVAGLSDAVVVNADGADSHACAIRRDATVVSWGNNRLGQLGDGSTTNRATPVAVPGLADVIDIALGQLTSCALRRSGEVLCWGRNGHGDLGIGTVDEDPHPTPVMVLFSAP